MKAFIASFIFVFVIGAFGFTEEQKAKGQGVMTFCMKKENVTDKEVIKLIEGDFSNDSRNIRCFASCFLEGVGFADSKGSLLPDIVVDKLSIDGDREKVQKVVNACKNINKDDKCEEAYELYKCYRTESGKLQ